MGNARAAVDERLVVIGAPVVNVEVLVAAVRRRVVVRVEVVLAGRDSGPAQRRAGAVLLLLLRLRERLHARRKPGAGAVPAPGSVGGGGDVVRVAELVEHEEALGVERAAEPRDGVGRGCPATVFETGCQVTLTNGHY